MSKLEGHRGRLKEKYINNGMNSFHHDYEKLEFLLTFIIPRKDVKPIAKELLEKFGSLEEVLKGDLKEIQEVQGVGITVGIFLNFLAELNKTLFKEHGKTQRIEINSKYSLIEYIRGTLAPYLKNEIGFDSRENFFVLYLDSANQLINDRELKSEILFRGTLDRSAVYPREIAANIIKSNYENKKNNDINELEDLEREPNKLLEKVIKYRAKSVIFAHNHPSGNYKPSRSDIELTQNLKQTLGMLDVRLLDHIIVTKESYFSFLEDGLLE